MALSVRPGTDFFIFAGPWLRTEPKVKDRRFSLKKTAALAPSNFLGMEPSNRQEVWFASERTKRLPSRLTIEPQELPRYCHAPEFRS